MRALALFIIGAAAGAGCYLAGFVRGYGRGTAEALAAVEARVRRWSRSDVGSVDALALVVLLALGALLLVALVSWALRAADAAAGAIG